MEDLHVRARTGSARAALLAITLISGSACGAAAAPDVSGTYWATEYHATIQVVGGGELPLTANGKAAYAMNMAGLQDGSVVDRARTYCTADGLPRALATPYPFEIIQAPPGQILIVHELNHMIRRIAMDETLPSHEDLVTAPYFNGHSVGHFDGDTLVIRTRGFKDETFIDATGAPHTNMLETTERIRRISATELEHVITIHDPEYYTRDWQARFVYTLRNDVRIEDYVCGFEHRDLSSVTGVRRP